SDKCGIAAAINDHLMTMSSKQLSLLVKHHVFTTVLLIRIVNEDYLHRRACKLDRKFVLRESHSRTSLQGCGGEVCPAGLAVVFCLCQLKRDPPYEPGIVHEISLPQSSWFLNEPMYPL